MMTYTSPITGDLAEFIEASKHYDGIAETITALQVELRKSFGPNQGDSIVALEQVWDEVEEELGQARLVSEDIVSALDAHHRELSDKVDLADAAVTAANQRFDELQHAEDLEGRCRADVADVVDRLAVATDEVASARIQGELDRAHNELDSAVRDLGSAQGAMGSAEDKLDELRDEEEQLNQKTAALLRSVNLGVLRDRGRMERWVRKAGEIYIELQFGELIDIAKGLEALVDGRYADMALHFKDALDSALLKASIAVLATSWIFPPAGIVFTGLVVGGFTSAAIGGAAWQQGWTHPETGKTTSAWDASFGIVMAVAPLRPLRATKAGLKTGGLRGIRTGMGTVSDAVANPGLRQSATRLQNMRGAISQADQHVSWARSADLASGGRTTFTASADVLKQTTARNLDTAKSLHVDESLLFAGEVALGVIGPEADDAVQWVADDTGVSK